MRNLLYFPRVYVAVPSELQSKSNLLRYLGMSEAELKKIWWFRSSMYHHFSIAKANGKTRIIDAPNYRLKMLQRKIATSLNKIYQPRKTVHGYVANRSVKTNAASHIRSKYVLNLDIEGFFPSISENRVRGLFEALTISATVSEILARICCHMGRLPQGAPSSPVISNMICFRFDKDLLRFAKETRCIYTRYADDITFSSHQPPTLLFEGSLPPAGKVIEDLLNAKLRSLFQNNGFKINERKIYYADRYSRRTVTGLKINELVNVDRRYVRNIRAALYVVEKRGTAAAQKMLNDKFKKQSNIGAHLKGRIAWVGNVKGRSDPIFRGLAERYNNLFPDQLIKILPTAQQILERAVWIVEHGEEDDEHMGQGTAFFLKSIGLVTAAHCVEGADEIYVYHPTKPSNKFKIEVAKLHAHRDLAILNHEIPTNEFYELDKTQKDVKTGEQLSAAGYPGFGPGDKINLRRGDVTSLPVKSAVQLIEVSQKLVQGMSGGPIFDDNNLVCGVIHKGGPGEGRDFAVHIDELNRWLQDK